MKLEELKRSRRTYEPDAAELPFIGEDSFWLVPQEMDYGAACIIGSEYAAHYLQFLKDSPEDPHRNLLGCIASNINFNDSQARGFWIGFFTHLDWALQRHAKSTSPFEELDALVEQNSVHAPP